MPLQRAYNYLFNLSGSLAVKVPVGADVTQYVVGGATVASPKIVVRCECKYYWCCYVKCKTCEKTLDLNVCR